MSEKSTRNRHAILMAAQGAILQGGAMALRVDRVAAAAGLNKRLIYHYFTDRAGLVEAVLRRQVEVLCGSSTVAILTREFLAGIFENQLPQIGVAEEGGTPPPARAKLQDTTPQGAQLQDAKFQDAKLQDAKLQDAKLLHEAARIIVPHVLGAGQAFASGVKLRPMHWARVCFDLLSLALPQISTRYLSVMPGTDGYFKVSERLLTAAGDRQDSADEHAVSHVEPKPVYRLLSDTRRSVRKAG